MPKVEQGPRVCPRLIVVLIQTMCVWAVAFYLDWITRVSNLNGPRVRPRLMVALTQTLFVWAVAFYLVGSQR